MLYDSRPLNDPGNMAEVEKSNELHDGEVTMALLVAFFELSFCYMMQLLLAWEAR